MRLIFVFIALCSLTGGLSAQAQQFVSFDLAATHSDLNAPAPRVEGALGAGFSLNYGVELPLTPFLNVRGGAGMGILQALQNRIDPTERIESNRQELRMHNVQYFLSTPVSLVWSLGANSPAYLTTGLRYQYTFGQSTYGWDDELAAANGHGWDCPGDGQVELDYADDVVFNRHQLHGELGVGFNAKPAADNAPQLFYEFRMTRAFNNYVDAAGGAAPDADGGVKNEPAPVVIDNDNFQASRLWTFAATVGTRF